MDYTRIFLNEIPNEGLVISAVFTEEEFYLELDSGAVASGLSFKGLLQRFSDRYILTGRIQGSWFLHCDRCLKAFTLPVETDILAHYVERKPNETGRTAMFDEIEEPEEIVTDSIDVIRALREQMILQIPMKALCSEDCRGLCVRCGRNLNDGDCGCGPQDGDPRMLKLKKLLEK